MADLVTLSDDTLRRLAESLRRQGHAPINTPRPQAPVDLDIPARLVRLARTCVNTEYPDYPTDPANCYLVEFGEMVPAAAPAPGVVTLTFQPYNPPDYRLALSQVDDPYLEQGTICHIALHHGRWWIHPPPRNTVVRVCLAEDHPGRGEEFEVSLGVWSDTAHKWVFGGSEIAIDWHYGGPQPSAGAQAWAHPMPSNEHGTIYVIYDLDCDSPGDCGD